MWFGLEFPVYLVLIPQTNLSISYVIFVCNAKINSFQSFQSISCLNVECQLPVLGNFVAMGSLLTAKWKWLLNNSEITGHYESHNWSERNAWDSRPDLGCTKTFFTLTNLNWKGKEIIYKDIQITKYLLPVNSKLSVK